MEPLDLAPYIKELISLNECIILPGFGGFETTYQPAAYDHVSKQMLPPSKKVNFKPDYIVGGEILESHISQKLHVEREEAKKIIEEYISQIKSGLSTHKIYEIRGVGKFNADSSGSIYFSPFSEETNLAESFGLEPLEISPKVEPPKISTPKKKQIPKIRPRPNTLTFVIVGLITISILLLLTILLSSKFDLYLFNLGDDTADNEMIILGGNYKKDSTYISYEKKLDEYTTAKQALQYTTPEPEQHIAQSKSFIIVAGSFKAFNYAQELKNRLTHNGFNADIVEAGGYYRVSMGKFDSKSEALTELHRIRTQVDRSVWLLTLMGN